MDGLSRERIDFGLGLDWSTPTQCSRAAFTLEIMIIMFLNYVVLFLTSCLELYLCARECAVPTTSYTAKDVEINQAAHSEPSFPCVRMLAGSQHKPKLRKSWGCTIHHITSIYGVKSRAVEVIVGHLSSYCIGHRIPEGISRGRLYFNHLFLKSNPQHNISSSFINSKSLNIINTTVVMCACKW